MAKIESSLETIAKGAGIVFIGAVITKLLGFFYRIIIARIGVEQYGLFSLGLAIYGIIAAISSLGLYLGVLRYVSYYKGKDDEAKVFNGSQFRNEMNVKEEEFIAVYNENDRVIAMYSPNPKNPNMIKPTRVFHNQ